ncbi:hypothetical protein Dimus_039765 [Dionaea muscipula]
MWSPDMYPAPLGNVDQLDPQFYQFSPAFRTSPVIDDSVLNHAFYEPTQMTGSVGVSGSGRGKGKGKGFISRGSCIPFQGRPEEEEEEEEYDEDEERPDGGPDDASLLINFSSHVAHVLWNGLVRIYFTNMHSLINFLMLF